MPHKSTDKLGIDIPAWIDEMVDDPCLQDILVQAVVARHVAIRDGATAPDAPEVCRKHVESASSSLELIERGTLKGQTAWYRATAALREFVDARAYVYPLQQRSRSVAAAAVPLSGLSRRSRRRSA